MLRRISLVLAGLFCMIGIVAQPAMADTAATTDASLNLTAGGAITLDQAPDVDFGTQTISEKAATYTTNLTTPIQVTNPGLQANYTVYATLGNFTAGDRILKGAVLTFGTATPLAKDSDNQSGVPTTLSNRKLYAGMTGFFSPMMIASPGSGIGVWQDVIQSAQLTVPAGNVAGSYHADITWTMTNAPS